MPGDGARVGERGDLVDHHAQPRGIVGGGGPVIGERPIEHLGSVGDHGRHQLGQQLLLDPDDLPGRADVGIEDDADLQELIKSFEAGPFADRPPLVVEPSFALVLAGQVVRGRIDAVYADADGGFLIVDWKTNRGRTADTLQLALYRLAWAELHDVPLKKVRAAFYYVREAGPEGLVEPPDLPDRAALEDLLTRQP